jgi:hypothetical protein
MTNGNQFSYATIARGTRKNTLSIHSKLQIKAAMFMDELIPIVREVVQHPIAFMGGLCSGLLRLNLSDDPVKSWLDNQAGKSSYSASTSVQNGKSGPQSISIE